MFVPKHNIRKVLQDITPKGSDPARKSTKSASARTFNMHAAQHVLFEEKKKRHFGTGTRLLGVFAALVLCVVGAYVTVLYQFRNDALGSFGKISAQMKDSVHALMALDSGSATDSLKEAHSEFRSFEEKGDRYGVWGIGTAIGSLWEPLKKAISSLGDVDDLLAASVSATEHLDSLKKNGPALFMSGKGGAVMLILKQLSADMKKLDAHSDQLMETTRALGVMAQTLDADDYLALKMKMYEVYVFLDALIALLDRPQDTHIALFFENPSEMRATGGFVGSYAVLTIHEGGLRDIEVRDIYDPDGQLDLNAVPPKPLQAITTRWGARDANWFFDYPTSARKILYFLENSKMYSERGVTFDGAIAINADAVASLVGVVGGIELPEYGVTLNEGNFLLEIQREVRSGKGRTAGEPKQVLKDVAPLLLEKLKGIDEAQMGELVAKIEEHIRYKNVLAYFKDGTLENVMVKAGAGGGVYQAPEGMGGDYLAVVNANIAGGKTDIFMDQHVVLSSTIDHEGNAQNELVISRSHHGAKEKYSWYRDTNQDYVRVYVPEGSKLIELKGNTAKKVSAPINYAKAGYEVDADVAREEEEGRAFGKTVFGAWLNTPAGATRKLSLTYETPNALTPKEGGVYEFVFERQAGVRGGFEYEVHAPLGFRWRESGSMVYKYASDNPEGRVKIPLTLERI